MFSQSAINGHILRIYEAAESPDLWGRVVSQLCRDLHGNSGMVVALDGEQRPALFSQDGVDAQAQAAYEQYFLAKDILLQRFRQAGNAESGWVGSRSQLISDTELEKTEYYADYMRPLHQFHQIGASVGRVGQYVFGGVTILRSKQTGNFDEGDIDLVTLLRPHIRQAFSISQRLSHLQCSKRVFDDVAQTLDVALVTIDQNGLVICMTPAAEAILRSGRGLRSSGNRIRATVPSEDAELQDLLGLTAYSSIRDESRRQIRGCGSMLLSRDGRKDLQITVMKPSKGSQIFSWQCRTCVLMTDLDKPLPPRGDLLRHIFGLSYSEARLADLLLEGLSLKEAEQLLRVTDSSVRFMSKTIFRKTGVRGQSGLMRLMLRLQSQSRFRCE